MTSEVAARLAACGFPDRWATAPRCVLLEVAFGQGDGVLAAWHAWRGLPVPSAAGPPRQLLIVAIAAEPPDLAALADGNAHTPWADLAVRLAQAWPPATPDLHLLDLEPGVRLWLAVGPAPWLRRLRLQADLLLLDPEQPPPGPHQGNGWDSHAMNALARLAAPGAVLLGGTLPHRHAAERPTSATPVANADRHVLIVGAGIAGACSAAALSRLGWTCTVLDTHAAPAQSASGNPAALFHGTVHAADGLHARFTRACALYASQLYGRLIADGVPGSADGLLRAHAEAFEGGDSQPAAWVQRLQGQALQQRWPWLQADSAWFYPGGGWVDAAAAVRHLLAAPGIRWMGGAQAHSLQRGGAGWQVLGASGACLASAAQVVLATAGTSLPLLAADGTPHSHALGLPAATRSRGQVTWFDSSACLPCPVAGGGYAVSWPAGHLLCGATSAINDGDPQPRDADHHTNLQRLAALTGIAPVPGSVLHGRVGWRHLTHDRLPWVGAAPSALQAVDASQTPLERLHDVARIPGLWVLAGLGGRGFTWAPLAGELLAAMLTDGPLPMDSRLLDAVDPARVVMRQGRQGRQADQSRQARKTAAG